MTDFIKFACIGNFQQLNSNHPYSVSNKGATELLPVHLEKIRTSKTCIILLANILQDETDGD